MSWSKEEVLLLVELVRRRPCLYDRDCQSFNDLTLKRQVGRELASIISATRPGTTEEDVINKWKELSSRFTSHYNNVLGKKKTHKRFFFDKMEFLSSYLEEQKNHPTPKKPKDKENKNVTNQETGNVGRLSQQEDRFPCLQLSRLNVADKDGVPETETECIDVSNRESISAVSIHSDNSSPISKKNPFFSSESAHCKKRKFSITSCATNATLHDVSSFTLASPLVNVSDSILDRTEPLVNDCHSFGNENSSFASRKTSSPNEDEDLLYVRYIACKLKKLEGSQKLNFKLQLEKLFYDSMNQ